MSNSLDLHYRKLPRHYWLLTPVPVVYELLYLPFFIKDLEFLRGSFWLKLLLTIPSIGFFWWLHRTGFFPEFLFWILFWLLKNIFLIFLLGYALVVKFFADKYQQVWKVFSALLFLAALVWVGIAWYSQQALETAGIAAFAAGLTWICGLDLKDSEGEYLIGSLIISMFFGFYLRDAGNISDLLDSQDEAEDGFIQIKHHTSGVGLGNSGTAESDSSDAVQWDFGPGNFRASADAYGFSDAGNRFAEAGKGFAESGKGFFQAEQNAAFQENPHVQHAKTVDEGVFEQGADSGERDLQGKSERNRSSFRSEASGAQAQSPNTSSTQAHTQAHTKTYTKTTFQSHSNTSTSTKTNAKTHTNSHSSQNQTTGEPEPKTAWWDDESPDWEFKHSSWEGKQQDEYSAEFSSDSYQGNSGWRDEDPAEAQRRAKQREEWEEFMHRYREEKRYEKRSGEYGYAYAWSSSSNASNSSHASSNGSNSKKASGKSSRSDSNYSGWRSFFDDSSFDKSFYDDGSAESEFANNSAGSQSSQDKRAQDQQRTKYFRAGVVSVSELVQIHKLYNLSYPCYDKLTYNQLSRQRKILMAKYHPDKATEDEREEFTNTFKLVNMGFEVLRELYQVRK